MSSLLPPPPYKENSHQIFTFCMDPTGQLRGRGSGPLDPLPPASYAAGRPYIEFVSVCLALAIKFSSVWPELSRTDNSDDQYEISTPRRQSVT